MAREPSNSGGSRLLKLGLPLSLVLVATAVLFWINPEWVQRLRGSSGSQSFSHLRTEIAGRHPFQITVVTQGFVDSRQNVTLRSEVEGSTTIISIVPEGTKVQPGDLICELDSSALVEKKNQQEIAVNDATSAVEQQIKQIEIQLATNESLIAAAQLKVELAELDLKSYAEGTYPQSISQLTGQVALREEELVRAQENFEFTRRLVNKGLRTQNELDARRLAVQQAEHNLLSAMGEREVLEEFTYERQMAELRANAEEFKRELERVMLQCEATIAQMQTELSSLQIKLALEQEKLDRYNAQIAACHIVAPQAGEVVYANLDSRGRGSDNDQIRERATVTQRQAIVNLPDVTQLKVDCRIHESLIRSVRPNLPVVIRLDAYPDRIFSGRIHSVSSVAMTGSWPNTDLREYATEVHFTDPPESIADLRPGLTAKLEIIVDSRQNVLRVPVQCVVTVGREQFAWVLTPSGPERRKLVVGATNTSHVEILDGIAEGERVIQNPRTHFAREISELETEAGEDGERVEAEPPVGLIPAASTGQTPAAPSAGPQGGNGPAGSGGPPGGGTGGNRIAELFTQLDADGDGQLSSSELASEQQLSSQFSEIDTDSNGFLSQEEVRTYFRNRFGGGRPPGGEGSLGNDAVAPSS